MSRTRRQIFTTVLAGLLGLLPARFLVPAAAAGDGDGDPYYFYHGLDYGSDTLIHPLRLIVNGSYGIMQLSNRDNRPLDVHYAQGWRNVWKNLLHPVRAIEVEGWNDFFEREVIPISLNGDNAQYWPNYTQHLIGGGMSYRMMVEWYRAHDYAHPGAWGVGTLAVYHLLNEVVENDDYSGWTTDPIADLYIFDPASIVLFSSDRVCRFFGRTLHMADWSYQPMIDPWHGVLVNNGQNYSLKWSFPFWSDWGLFYHYGTHGELGLTHKWDNGRALSFGGGFKADELVNVTRFHKGAELVVTGGVFYDLNNSLLASVLWAKSKSYRLRVNVYPGLFEVWGLRPGLALNLYRDDTLTVGINLTSLKLPFGLAAGNEPTPQ